MKVIILSDSLGVPRPKNGIKKKKTYSNLLKLKNKISVTFKGRPGATIKNIYYLIKDIKNQKNLVINKKNEKLFDLCIIHCGIVDCTPRPFNKAIMFILSKIPFFKDLLKKLSRSNFFLSRFGKPWISEKVFLKTLLKVQLLSKIIAKKTLFIEIARPAHYMIKNCGDFSIKVKRYNNILKSISGQKYFLKIFNGKPADKYLLRDGHHLNLVGHQLIYKRIKSIID
ncbi:hypothetical protein OAM73_03185 [Candidatus Pelagibacter sp.]|nr:hypothetical protein [Candidatus Pelagibacter sp.]